MSQRAVPAAPDGVAVTLLPRLLQSSDSVDGHDADCAVTSTGWLVERMSAGRYELVVPFPSPVRISAVSLTLRGVNRLVIAAGTGEHQGQTSYFGQAAIGTRQTAGGESWVDALQLYPAVADGEERRLVLRVGRREDRLSVLVSQHEVIKLRILIWPHGSVAFGGRFGIAGLEVHRQLSDAESEAARPAVPPPTPPARSTRSTTPSRPGALARAAPTPGCRSSQRTSTAPPARRAAAQSPTPRAVPRGPTTPAATAPARVSTAASAPRPAAPAAATATRRPRPAVPRSAGAAVRATAAPRAASRARSGTPTRGCGASASAAATAGGGGGAPPPAERGAEMTEARKQELLSELESFARNRDRFAHELELPLREERCFVHRVAGMLQLGHDRLSRVEGVRLFRLAKMVGAQGCDAAPPSGQSGPVASASPAASAPAVLQPQAPAAAQPRKRRQREGPLPSGQPRPATITASWPRGAPECPAGILCTNSRPSHAGIRSVSDERHGTRHRAPSRASGCKTTTTALLRLDRISPP